jgi:hypothetical protein
MGSSSGNQPWIPFLSSVFGFPESTSCLDTDSEWALAYYLGSMMSSCFAGYICAVSFFVRSKNASLCLLLCSSLILRFSPRTHGHPSDLFKEFMFLVAFLMMFYSNLQAEVLKM